MLNQHNKNIQLLPADVGVMHKKEMKDIELEIGNVYFMCSWLSHGKPVPEIETWVYSGTEESEEEGIKYCFQDPESFYLETIISELTKEQKNIYAKPEGPKLIWLRYIYVYQLNGSVYQLSDDKDLL